MSWDRSRPGGRGYVNPKYRTPEHRAAGVAARVELKRAGSGTCAEIKCEMQSRLIAPGMDLHLCHNRQTGAILGLGHATCNRIEAARWARAQQTASALRW